MRSLDIHAATHDPTLIEALDVLLAHEHSRGEYLTGPAPLDFVSDLWRRAVLVTKDKDGDVRLARRPFELCVLSYVAAELKNGDLYVQGSEEYADYRAQLLPWAECEPLVADYCAARGVAPTAHGFVADLKTWLASVAAEVDRTYPDNGQVVIGQDGEPVLKRLVRKEPPEGTARVEAALLERMPERNLLDVLCNVEHWTGWTRHFGPPSGSDPKLDRAKERYILATFGYATNMGPAQLARHTRGLVTPHMISFVNHQHVTVAKLDAAARDIVRAYGRFDLPSLWGTGKVAAADGTKFSLYEDNLVSEFSLRYGDYGGIAYHHVADTYVALLSHFITCGSWEAIYILDLLYKNLSEVTPDTLHADTQGQNAPVFALAYLLGVQLQPRIRNWGDLIFYRPTYRSRKLEVSSRASRLLHVVFIADTLLHAGSATG